MDVALLQNGFGELGACGHVWVDDLADLRVAYEKEHRWSRGRCSR